MKQIFLKINNFFITEEKMKKKIFVMVLLASLILPVIAEEDGNSYWYRENVEMFGVLTTLYFFKTERQFEVRIGPYGGSLLRHEGFEGRIIPIDFRPTDKSIIPNHDGFLYAVFVVRNNATAKKVYGFEEGTMVYAEKYVNGKVYRGAIGY